MSTLALNPKIAEDFQTLAETPGLLTGIFPGIDGDLYHKGLPGISKTSIELAALSPANMMARMIRKNDTESEALMMGKLFHSRVEHSTELEKFKALFVVMPVFAGVGSKKAKEDWLVENKGKLLVDQDQVDQIEGMFDGLMANPQSRALVEVEGASEETVFWTDPESGVLCKCRPDKRIPNYLGGPLVVDWKSIGMFSKKECADSIFEHDYHVSAAFTLDGLRAVGLDPGPYVCVFVQKKAPHNVLCVQIPEIDVEIGRRKYKAILKQIAECQQTGIWPGFVDLGLPEWARQREMSALAMT
jgi:exodeoxyribonuclease VIII